ACCAKDRATTAPPSEVAATSMEAVEPASPVSGTKSSGSALASSRARNTPGVLAVNDLVEPPTPHPPILRGPAGSALRRRGPSPGGRPRHVAPPSALDRPGPDDPAARVDARHEGRALLGGAGAEIDPLGDRSVDHRPAIGRGGEALHVVVLLPAGGPDP